MPIDTFSLAERSAGAPAATPGRVAFIAHELASVGLTSDRLLLVGFNHGTITTLHVGLRHDYPVAGIIAISRMPVAPDRLEGDIRSRPPILLIHGTDDDVVPFRSIDFAATALTANGAAVETHMQPDVGQSVD